MAELWNGAAAAAAITEELIRRAEELKKKNTVPTLCILRVGEREEDLAYEKGAFKRCEKVGIRPVAVSLPADCTQERLLREIEKVNRNPQIHGCLLFRPLPEQIDERTVCEALVPEKDVDCMTGVSLVKLLTGKGRGYCPCTAQAVIELLKHYGTELEGKNVTVIGRSLVIGKPVSLLLQAENATVTVCHTKTRRLAEICKRADILVTAAGKAGIVDRAFVHPDQTVIDVGINTGPDGGICGDVNFDDVKNRVKAITPVPGGVGVVTTAVLAKHVIEAAEDAVYRERIC